MNFEININTLPKWRKYYAIFFLIVSLAFILTTVLYFVFTPQPPYDKNFLKIKNEQASCGPAQVPFEEKDLCIAIRLDCAQYDVSVCRLFAPDDFAENICYGYYPHTVESWMYKLKTKVAVFLSLMVLMMIGSFVFKTTLFAWGVLAGVIYNFLADVFLSNKFPFLSPPYRTFWELIPCAIGGILGVVIYYYLLKKYENSDLR